MIDIFNIDTILGESQMSQEDTENNAIIMESVILESMTDEEISDFAQSEEMQLLISEGVLNERTIVKFDKKAKLSRAESVAALAIAKEHNDRYYKKLVTLWKMRKICLDNINRKYGAQAKQRAREMVKKSKMSSSSMVRKAVSKK